MESSGPLLSIILPEGWERGSGSLAVEANLAHGVRAQAANELVAGAEQVLGAMIGRPVAIQVQAVFPTLDNGGHTAMVALGLVLATTLITGTLVPYLILEEKTTHTLDALLVAPVTVNQVILGKGLAGVVYGLLAAAVLLAFNLSLVNLWSLMVLAVLALVLTGVGLGLLVGTFVENEGAVQMWILLLVFLLMVPLLTVALGSSRLPTWALQLAAWFPTAASYDLARLSFGAAWSASQIWPRLVAVLFAAGLILAAAAWRLRTWER